MIINMKIPKKIFKTHITKDIPPDTMYQINRLKDLNPDYEYIYHDNEDMERYIKDNFDDSVHRALMRIKPGAGKADIWRLAVICREGGVYIDLDRVMHDNTPPLNTLINDDDEFIHGRNWHRFGYNAPAPNSMLISRPNHPIIKNTLLSVVDSVNNNKPLVAVGHRDGCFRSSRPDGGPWGGELESYTGTPHLWKAMSDYLGFVDLWQDAPEWVEKGILHEGIRITNSVERYFKQHDAYGADHVTMGGQHWTVQDVFNS